MNRNQKLQKLQKNKATKKPETIQDFAVLFDVMQDILKEFKETLANGVPIQKLEVLVNHLDRVGDLEPSLVALKDALINFPKLPEEVKIASVNEFLEAISKIEVKSPDIKLPEQKEINIPDYSKSVKALADAVQGMTLTVKAAVEGQKRGQKANDYVPYRRVIKKGTSFVFDDQPTPQAGGTGGSTTPSRKNSSGEVYVPVANADGSAIGSIPAEVEVKNDTGSPVPVRHSDGTYQAHIGKLEADTGVATASGDTTILTVSTGQKVLIYALSFVPTTSALADINVLIKIGSTNKLGWRTNFSGGGYAESFKNDQWIEGADGEDVVINLSAANSIRWNLKYKLVSV